MTRDGRGTKPGIPHPRLRGLGFPGLQGNVSLTNQAPTAVPANRPAGSQKGALQFPPRAPPPRIEIWYSDVPGTHRNHFPGRRGGGPALLAFTPPLSTPGSSTVSPHLEVSPPQLPYAPGAKTRLPGCAGSQYAGAPRWRGRLRFSLSYLEEESEGRLAHA